MVKESRILGVDFGEKRIGLALSDPLLTFAYPLKTIKNDKNLWKNFDDTIIEKNVSKIILGIPDSNRNKELSRKILNLKIELEKRFGFDVILWNEEFTSAIAQERIIQSVVKKKKRRDKGLIDQNSAAVILQEYLDS